MRDKTHPDDEHRRHRKKEEAECPKPHHDELDEALAGSFPASDVPAPVSRGTTSNPRPHEKEEAED
jgi:hypothetical protein